MPRTKRLIISDETAVYHVMSRTALDGFPLGDIEKDRIIDLTVRAANVFFEAIENPPAPDKKLKEAMKAYKETLHNAEN